jgi:hypothetical protein
MVKGLWKISGFQESCFAIALPLLKPTQLQYLMSFSPSTHTLGQPSLAIESGNGIGSTR